MMKMETKRALKIECIIRMEEPVFGETVNGRLVNSRKALATWAYGFILLAVHLMQV